MNRRKRWGATVRGGVAVLLLGCAACATVPQVSPDTPEGILARAIEQAGGAEALERARALVWEGDATVHAGGRTVAIAGTWAVQPPDTAVVSTYPLERGPGSVRHMVLAAPRGWLVGGQGFTPMQPNFLANERDAFFLYSVMRLVPLRGPGVALSALPRDSAGERGILVRQPGRPEVELYVDSTGRASRIRMRVHDVGTGAPIVQDARLGGTIEAGGVRWPRTLRLTHGGAPYFDLRLRTLRVLPTIQDTLLAGPH